MKGSICDEDRTTNASRKEYAALIIRLRGAVALSLPQPPHAQFTNEERHVRRLGKVKKMEAETLP